MFSDFSSMKVNVNEKNENTCQIQWMSEILLKRLKVERNPSKRRAELAKHPGSETQ